MTPDLKLNFRFYCPFYFEINLFFNYLIKIDGRKYIDIENLVTRTVGTRSHTFFFCFTWDQCWYVRKINPAHCKWQPRCDSGLGRRNHVSSCITAKFSHRAHR